MSRHFVTNQSEFNRIISSLVTSNSAPHHRLLLIVESAPAEWLQQYAASQAIKFVASINNTDRADRISALLGCEFDTLIHELATPVDAGLLAALAGTVKSEGILILGLPFPVCPPTSDSVATARFDTLVSTEQCSLDSTTTSRFNQRFARLIREFEAASPSNVCIVCFTDSLPVQAVNPRITTSLPDSTQPLPLPLNTNRQQEQNELFTQACDYLAQHNQGCITITGKRGRGKSVLLTRVSNWLNERSVKHLITAGNRSALASYRKHSTSQVQDYLPPAKICASSNQVLLIDEAGNLPIDVLTQLLNSHPCVIFCTTVEGYESAGRAFDVRFLKQIEQLYPNFLQLQPHCSWRWYAHDPIEQLMNQLLLSDASYPTTVHQDPAPYTPSVHVRQLDRQQLTNNETTLKAVFGLLRETHYQTSVLDLQHLMDGANVQLWVLELGAPRKLAAVVVLSLEGKIDISLHDAIVCKRRRLPHQLLPQLLAQMANQAEALNEYYARIIRISVAPMVRRSGLGSHLIQHIDSQLKNTPITPCIQTLGASFASDTVSLAFWQANGFTEFHRGFRHNPRTGKQAVAVIKTGNTTVHCVVKRAAAIHQDNQGWRGSATTDKPMIKNTQPQTELLDNELLRRFSLGQRSANDTYAALARLDQQHSISLNANANTSQRAHESQLRKAVTILLDRI